MVTIFNRIEDPLEVSDTPTAENINSEDGLNVFMSIVNSSSKPLHDGMLKNVDDRKKLKTIRIAI